MKLKDRIGCTVTWIFILTVAVWIAIQVLIGLAKLLNLNE